MLVHPPIFMLVDSTHQWESLEQWRATPFLVAGGLFLLNTGYEGIGRYTTLWDVGFLGALTYLSALIVSLVGLLGFYRQLADRSPRLAQVSAAVVVVAGGGLVVLLVWASITTLLNRPMPPGALLFLNLAAIVLGFLLFTVASLLTRLPSRTVSLLLLGFVAAWAAALVLALVVYSGNAPDWLAVILNGVSAVILLAIGYHLRTETEPTDRTEPAPDATAR